MDARDNGTVSEWAETQPGKISFSNDDEIKVFQRNVNGDNSPPADHTEALVLYLLL